MTVAGPFDYDECDVLLKALGMYLDMWRRSAEMTKDPSTRVIAAKRIGQAEALVARLSG